MCQYLKGIQCETEHRIILLLTNFCRVKRRVNISVHFFVCDKIMPDYYLIPETADIKRDEPIRGWSKCSVSRPCGIS